MIRRIMPVRPGCSSRWSMAALFFAGFLAALPAFASAYSFRNDVQAVLSKAGCNMGACHGNANGKAGFKLSLRGEDAEYDYAILTRELFGRRVNITEPDQSLILLKATTQLAHEGGRRFATNSIEYEMLRSWIADGAGRDPDTLPTLTRLEVTPTQKILIAPAVDVKITARAYFSDGTARDVTGLAVYDPAQPIVTISHDGSVHADRTGETTVIVRFLNQQVPVRLAFIPARPEFVWSKPSANNFIDEQIFAKLQTLRMNPSALCTDGEFMRRAFLDLVGELPTADEARAFVADTRKNKRARLVDQLLERPEFADFWAVKWSDLLKNEEKVLDRKGVQAFHQWIRQSIASNKPMDQFVRELIGARGSSYQNPAANYYRANRDPVARSVSTAQLFLGTRLQCAQCHNHPFDRWTQNDYYDWAGVFARVDYKILENRRRDDNDKHEFIGEQVIFSTDKGDVKHPKTGKPVEPRFLGVSKKDGTDFTDLQALADWITSAQNPFFARSQVNRIWYHLMGRGIVDPIDDFRATNPPSHPELLEALTKEFIAQKFDLRHMIRLIMNSRTYQLSPTPTDGNRDDEINYAFVIPRRLSAEQLLDTVHEVTGVPTKFNGYPTGLRASQIPGVEAVRSRDRRPGGDDQFLIQFGKPPRLLPSECERTSETSMSQAFQLISGSRINDLLTESHNRLSAWIDSGRPTAEIITELYWTALTRMPTDLEQRETLLHVEKAKDRRSGLEDVCWALLNAKEFVLRK